MTLLGQRPPLPQRPISGAGCITTGAHLACGCRADRRLFGFSTGGHYKNGTTDSIWGALLADAAA